jgi:hypothetical protein
MNLSSSTQTDVEGLLLDPKGLICRSALRHEIFEIDSAEFWNPELTEPARRCSVRAVHPDEIMRVDVIELKAGALIEHVRVDPVGAQQGDTLLSLGSLLL